jgi:hypothetical protein
MDLDWLADVTLTGSVPDHDVQETGLNDHEHHRRHDEHHFPQVIDPATDRTLWIQSSLRS